ncbi:type II toxin-antitoxin system VapC family toxin [cf. Phormidesmis sp. LEGE 11477]|uniref:type II toxin-antitoxin system VapC family toxin n=1 Tax=cf. Phormidesmis sp. LEGE 11477 TaxID=1828680 RepID=UPI001880AF7C|nr:PIN domain-containing protein [cf. Phormidesmis sp. LEGE 11477]MBE9062290.1 PIN domain-containing protein [cf. Phormidesmis sp. LEGE 11477]
MLQKVIVDTSALIASIDKSESHHEWVVQQLESIEPPLLTCEAVISETWFLLGRVRGAREAFLPYLEEGQVEVAFSLEAELASVLTIMKRYKSVPASLADAELARMAELYPQSSVFTLDSDFQIYRKHRDIPIPVLFPSI